MLITCITKREKTMRFELKVTKEKYATESDKDLDSISFLKDLGFSFYHEGSSLQRYQNGFEILDTSTPVETEINTLEELVELSTRLGGFFIEYDEITLVSAKPNNRKDSP